MGAAYLLPRLVGLGHATRLLMLGDTVDAAEAERIGLISELADDGELRDEAARALARRLADGPGPGVRADQGAAHPGAGHEPVGGAVELEAMTQALLMTGEDYAEFHAAFTAGREPQWQGR